MGIKYQTTILPYYEPTQLVLPVVKFLSNEIFRLRRIAIIRADNERLRSEVESLVAVRLEAERKAEEVHQAVKKEVKRDRRHIPGEWTSTALPLAQSKSPLPKLVS